MMPWKKCTLKRKTKKLAISNHCLSRLVQCISIKLGKFVWWSFLVITNKFARICLNILFQSLESGKDDKVVSFHVEAVKTFGFVPGIPSQTCNMTIKVSFIFLLLFLTTLMIKLDKSLIKSSQFYCQS